MSSKPILYSAPMIRAKLAGRKRVTRRLTGLETLNRAPNDWRLAEIETTRVWFVSTNGAWSARRLPFQIGDTAWAQEAHVLSEVKSLTLAIPSFEVLWTGIHGQASWKSNPWVWRIETKPCNQAASQWVRQAEIARRAIKKELGT